jgi:hypothetical protein
MYSCGDLLRFSNLLAGPVDRREAVVEDAPINVTGYSGQHGVTSAGDDEFGAIGRYV